MRNDNQVWLSVFIASFITLFIYDSLRGYNFLEAILWASFSAAVSVSILIGLRKILT